jgi:hypothetical protein
MHWLRAFFQHDIWVQNAILAITAVVGIWTLRSNSQQERRRATVDLVLQSFEDAELISSRKRLNHLVKAKLDIPHLLSEKGSDDRFVLFSIANRYEFIAAGLRESAFDKEVYKRVYYSSAVRDWDHLAPLIYAYRNSSHRPTAFQEFERLVEEWKRKPLKANKKPRTTARPTSRTVTAPPASPTPPSTPQ